MRLTFEPRPALVKLFVMWKNRKPTPGFRESWPASKEQRENAEMFAGMADSKACHCPVCGKMSVRVQAGRYKHSRRIVGTKGGTIMQTTYCELGGPK